MMNLKKASVVIFVAAVPALYSTSLLACDLDKDSASNKPSFSLVTTANAKDAAPGIHVATFHVKGMVCSSCRKKVNASLKKLKGVQKIVFKHVKHKLDVAEVTYTGDKIDGKVLIKAIQDAGFKAANAPRL